MANYQGVYRTNYFKVIDEDVYQKLIDEVQTVNDFNDFTLVTEDKQILHGFGGQSIFSYPGGEENFFKALKKIIPDNEVFIMVESGHAELDYITGNVTVVTKSSIKYSSLIKMYETFCQELGIKSFITPYY